MSLLLIATGAILAIAVNYSVSGIDIKAIGAILVVVGIIGLLFSTIIMMGFFASHEGGGEHHA
jgi:hypothetical protein